MCHTHTNNNNGNSKTAKGNDVPTTDDPETDSGKRNKYGRPLHALSTLFFVFRFVSLSTQTLAFKITKTNNLAC